MTGLKRIRQIFPSNQQNCIFMLKLNYFISLKNDARQKNAQFRHTLLKVHFLPFCDDVII
jgi:hypothetical protein